MDLNVGGDLAGADLHLLIAYQEVDPLRDHDICANKNLGVKAVDDVKLSSNNSFDSFASLELSAGDPNCCDDILRSRVLVARDSLNLKGAR